MAAIQIIFSVRRTDIRPVETNSFKDTFNITHAPFYLKLITLGLSVVKTSEAVHVVKDTGNFAAILTAL